MHCCTLAAMRWALGSGLLVAGGVLAWRLASFASTDVWGTWRLAFRGAALSAGLYACGGVGIALVGAALGRTWSMVPVAMTITFVALLAAVPVDFAYDDGCNDHQTTSAIGLIPVLALTRPEGATLSYEQLQTLVACPAPSTVVQPLGAS
jgi:hypothetical protein